MFITFIKYLIDPFTVFWLLLLAIIAAWYWNKERWVKWLAGTALLCFLMISTPLLPNMVIRSLESQYEPLIVEKLIKKDLEYHIIVLGAGHRFDSTMPPNTLLGQSALRRLTEGIRLHNQLPDSKLVLSGFSTVGGITGAAMLKKTALLLGVEEQSILLQEEPVNTFEEAKYYADEYGTSHPLILVTAAAHMPRAMMTFQQYGIIPIPSPTDFKLTGSRKGRWLGLPEVANIEKLSAGIYEHIGILYYKLIIE